MGMTRLLASIRLLFNRLTNPEPYGNNSSNRFWSFGPKLNGIRMTPAEALRLSAVWACVSVISKAIASSDWNVYRRAADGNQTPDVKSMAYRLLQLRPNPEMTPMSFREAMLIMALVWGDAYAEIELDTVGRPVALWPIMPERACLERNESGRLVLRVSNYGKADTTLDYNSVYHIHGPGIDGIAGFNVVSLAARSLGHAAAAEAFGQAYYENGTAMGGIISTDQAWTPDQVESLKGRINQEHGGVQRAFRWLILTAGMKYQSVSSSPEDAQSVETRYLLIEEICRWFGVPPHKIAHLLRSTFSNIEHQGLEFVRDALIPWAERCRQEAEFKLIPSSSNLTVRIDLEYLSEGDAQSKAATDSILVQNGLMTRNEARRRRGLNTLGPDGDLLTVQVNMTTLDRIANPPEPATAEPPQQELQPAARIPKWQLNQIAESNLLMARNELRRPE